MSPGPDATRATGDAGGPHLQGAAGANSRPGFTARRWFTVYSYLGPALLLPLGYWLWWRRGDGSHALALFALSLPVVFAYVIPGIGTNLLGLWEFTTRLRLGKFRPHHGFVFGAATSVIAWLALAPASGPFCWGEVARAAFVLGSVLAVWNWLYDAAAIRAGVIVVYNAAAAAGRGPEAIAAAYAPALFGGCGACYGALIRLAEAWLAPSPSAPWFLPQLCAAHAVMLTLPVALFVAQSWWRTGATGLRPARPLTDLKQEH